MSEDEAKTKWCCGPLQNLRGMMVLSYIANGSAKEIEETFPSRGFCIGSDCMAWRWEGEVDHGGPDDHGYCGLAGKP